MMWCFLSGLALGAVGLSAWQQVVVWRDGVREMRGECE